MRHHLSNKQRADRPGREPGIYTVLGHTQAANLIFYFIMPVNNSMLNKQKLPEVYAKIVSNILEIVQAKLCKPCVNIYFKNLGINENKNSSKYSVRRWRHSTAKSIQCFANKHVNSLICG